ncbi:NADH dehydrogenase [ubiquinone] 1 beta subcomplex subunit 7 [Hylaeus anthracinus]|uniref:NADH dehydrogenase [ubiquinone] 1 beta subcomplex subunit 7 n=1 Tax=Hylaeus anthracinus TaxID=313031 RepID=UPI0023BA2C8F|nr:NADH dehydrogenase [ubiquinone] 1 beta subcomplex subunit 7 [Hylaeus anthracinus]
MGNVLTTFGNWSEYPEGFKPPSFDPQLGFPNGRKERVMMATEQEMIAGKVPKKFRDYCAHKYLEYSACERRHWPIHPRCRQEQHAYIHCQAEDYYLRMKEYERERRLQRREKRKMEKQNQTAAAAS